jgi:hypothetical protein
MGMFFVPNISMGLIFIPHTTYFPSFLTRAVVKDWATNTLAAKLPTLRYQLSSLRGIGGVQSSIDVSNSTVPFPSMLALFDAIETIYGPRGSPLKKIRRDEAEAKEKNQTERYQETDGDREWRREMGVDREWRRETDVDRERRREMGVDRERRREMGVDREQRREMGVDRERRREVGEEREWRRETDVDGRVGWRRDSEQRKDTNVYGRGRRDGVRRRETGGEGERMKETTRDRERKWPEGPAEQYYYGNQWEMDWSSGNDEESRRTVGDEVQKEPVYESQWEMDWSSGNDEELRRTVGDEVRKEPVVYESQLEMDWSSSNDEESRQTVGDEVRKEPVVYESQWEMDWSGNNEESRWAVGGEVEKHPLTTPPIEFSKPEVSFNLVCEVYTICIRPWILQNFNLFPLNSPEIAWFLGLARGLWWVDSFLYHYLLGVYRLQNLESSAWTKVLKRSSYANVSEWEQYITISTPTPPLTNIYYFNHGEDTRLSPSLFLIEGFPLPGLFPFLKEHYFTTVKYSGTMYSFVEKLLQMDDLKEKILTCVAFFLIQLRLLVVGIPPTFILV